MPIVTVQEYARMQKCSRQNIERKIKDGIISARSLVKVKGAKKIKIDSEVADLEIEMSGNEPEKVAHESLHPQAAEVSRDELKESMHEALDKYRTVRMSTEHYRARKLELEIAETEGRLLDVDLVRKRILKLCAETRDTLLNIPAKLAPVLVSITDPLEMENKLLEEINVALQAISRLEK